MDEVRDTFIHNGYGLRKNGRFSVLKVADVNQILSGIFVEHKPEDDDPYHSGICGFTREQEKVVALKLRMLVIRMFPALK